MKPDVTVLMAVYNGERHLGAAIESILAQTHRHFELLIVDDGSTDRSREIAFSYRDPRIRVVALDHNVGLSTALNEGLRVADAPLVARQDADDLSEPERLERQLAVMARRPDVALLGSQAIAIAESGKRTGAVRRCLSAASIRWFSVFDNPFIHTSVMFRTAAVRTLGGFSASYDPFSQDYDLWCRVMESHAVVNLPEPLVRYRVSGTSIIGGLVGTRAGDYERRFERIARELTARQARRVFGVEAISEAESELLAGFVLGLDGASVAPFLSLFERLLARYREQHPDSASADFRRTLAGQFDAMARRARPATRRAAATIYGHLIWRHPELAVSVSWTRAVAAVLLGGTARDRMADLKRRRWPIARL